MAAPQTLSRRALNRAILARQGLLQRERRAPLEVVEHLVGLQAQVPANPYVALWSRVEAFEPSELSAALVERRAVRLAVMRSTIHLVTADDALALRALTQPVLERQLRGQWSRGLVGVDLDEAAALGRALVEERPRTGAELGAALTARWPQHAALPLSNVVRTRVPMVQVPPRGTWGASHQATHTSLEAWLGRALPAVPDVDRAVLRYLGAFGPATVPDAQVWCGLTGLREVFARLRPHLVTFRDEQARELFDLPDAPRPDPDAPSPVRLLPEYDNLLLSHRDRSRMLAADYRPPAAADGRSYGTVLVDGVVRAVWRPERDGRDVTLVVHPRSALDAGARAEVVAEAERLLAFTDPVATTRAVVFDDERRAGTAPTRRRGR